MKKVLVLVAIQRPKVIYVYVQRHHGIPDCQAVPRLIPKLLMTGLNLILAEGTAV
jgi:hypothetical protein